MSNYVNPSILRRFSSKYAFYTELHQNEMIGMETHMAHTVERMERVEYRFMERTNDLEEELQNCETNISMMEKHQEEQMGEGVVDMDVRLLVSKLLQVVVNVFALVVFLVNSFIKVLIPFVCSRYRLALSFTAVVVVATMWRGDGHVYSVALRLQHFRELLSRLR